MNRKFAGRALGVLFCLLAAGCGGAMAEQPKVEPLEVSVFFPDAQSARPVAQNTVPRSVPVADPVFTSGRENGELVATIPVSLTEAFLARGQEQYNVFCVPCHGVAGYGDGVVVQRGFPPPPSYHSERLRQAPAGYLFDVIGNGFGEMYAYGARVPPADRWAIVAYIRALQLSQHAPADFLPPGDIDRLGGEE